MLRSIRSRLSYANVVATMALFIALGGVSYAAVTLPSNSVGRTQIKKNAVTGSKVMDKSLTAADFNGSVQGRPGAAGPAGAKGDTGAKGATGADGATGPSDAYVSHLGGGIDSAATDTEVTSVNVPAGSYVVTAKLYGLRQPGTSGLLCSLSNGVDQLDFTNSGSNTLANEPYIQLPLEGFVTVAAPATLRLSCSGNGAVITMFGITLTALKVGALHG